MAEKTNKHGLPRYIDAEVKLLVRQRCGFGCVVCGNAVVQYHHFDPPFEDAKEHRAEGITLLCGRCHDQVTRGLWSDDKIRRSNTNPKARTTKPHHLIDLAPPVNLVFGSMMFRGGTGPWINIGTDRLLEVRFDGDGNALLSARFSDAEGNPTVLVVDNELEYCDGAWDIEVIGTSLKVRRGPRELVFDAVLHPPHSIYVRKFAVSHLGWTIHTDDEGTVQITNRPAVARAQQGFSLSGDGIVSTRDGVCIFGGPLHLQTNGRFTQTGGFMAGSYPADRFRKLALAGELDRLAWEVAEQPIIYVSPARDPRNPVPMLPPTRLDSGLMRYATFCEVCNTVPIGTRDVPADAPRPSSGMTCGSCADLPPDGWRVTDGLGQEFARYESKVDAENVARELLAKSPNARVVVVGLPGDRLKFHFTN